MSTDYKNYRLAMSTVKDYKSLLKLLREEGYTINRQNGSHVTLRNAIGKTVTIKDNKVARGTLRNVLQLVYPHWNVKPVQEDTTDQQEVKAYDLTDSMLALCEELELNPSELTEDDYLTLVELTKV